MPKVTNTKPNTNIPRVKPTQQKQTRHFTQIPHRTINYKHSGWYKVTVLNGKSFNKDYVISSLTTCCKFIPVLYSAEGLDAVFYVKNAQELTKYNGILKLKIYPTDAPQTANIDERCEGILERELAARYKQDQCALYLSNFVMSPSLIDDYFLPLSRIKVVHAVFKILAKHTIMENLVTLDLSNNNIVSLDAFHGLLNNAYSLKFLNLSNNKIQNPATFKNIHGIKIVELCINGNPIAKHHNISDEMKQHFPSILKLDNIYLSSPSGSSNFSQQAWKVVTIFFDQYISLYDSNNRTSLLPAYHNDALFSMIYDPEIRNYQLNNLQGSTTINNFLHKQPKTSHNRKSFKINIPVALERFIIFNVMGTFIQIEETNTTLKFSRTFAIIPYNTGHVIVNETFFITNPTKILETSTNKEPIIQLLSDQTKMNLEWSKMCLVHNNWNYTTSLNAFWKLKKQDKIPPQAFNF